MNKLIIGKRYKLPHGIGVLIGFEEFYDDGNRVRLINSIPKHLSNSTRFIFQLEKNHTWEYNSTGHRNSVKYTAWGNQIQKLDEEEYVDKILNEVLEDHNRYGSGE